MYMHMFVWKMVTAAMGWSIGMELVGCYILIVIS